MLDKIRVIKESNEARGRDYKQEIVNEVAGQHIVTTYNKRTYRVDDVCFDKSPDSTFTLVSQGEEYHVTFADYLKSQHKVDVVDTNQPLLVVFDFRREQIVYLVPEHCRFIGLSDAIMDDFKAFREVRFTRRTDAPVKIKESSQFVSEVLSTNEAVVGRMKAWSFFFDPKVVEFPGFKYDAGNVVMGHKPRLNTFSNSGDTFSRLQAAATQEETK